MNEVTPVERVHVHAAGHIVAVDVELLEIRDGEIVPAARIMTVDGWSPAPYLTQSEGYYKDEYGLDYNAVLSAANRAALARVVKITDDQGI